MSTLSSIESPNNISEPANISASCNAGTPPKPMQAQPANDGEPEKKKRDKGAFKFKHFTIRHDLCGMKVGTDAVLLTGYPITFLLLSPLSILLSLLSCPLLSPPPPFPYILLFFFSNFLSTFPRPSSSSSFLFCFAQVP
jgi:hypothetical protein